MWQLSRLLSHRVQRIDFFGTQILNAPGTKLSRQDLNDLLFDAKPVTMQQP